MCAIKMEPPRLTTSYHNPSKSTTCACRVRLYFFIVAESSQVPAWLICIALAVDNVGNNNKIQPKF